MPGKINTNDHGVVTISTGSRDEALTACSSMDLPEVIVAAVRALLIKAPETAGYVVVRPSNGGWKIAVRRIQDEKGFRILVATAVLNAGGEIMAFNPNAGWAQQG